MDCPCNQEIEFSKCCEPFINGDKVPVTAEELLRSRYTAFTLANMDYIQKTHDPKTRHQSDMNANKEWAESVEWKGLEILGIDGGGPRDQEAHLEFKCYFEDSDGDEQIHHEVSEFRKKQGKWFFHEATHLNEGEEPYVREEPKVGRNDPCVCGSGKKYKKCCGAN